MNIAIGQMVFVSDEFFRKVGDPFLKINYEDTKRPHYFAFRDSTSTLYWLVPCSSRIEKFEAVIQQRKERRKPTDGIRFAKVQGAKVALLFQDMFPVTERYIQESYIRGGQPVRIADPKIVAELERHAGKVIALLRRGIRFTPTQPNAIHIETLMLNELEN
jgi:hypothetical protein